MNVVSLVLRILPATRGETEEALRTAVEKFRTTFLTSSGQHLNGGDTEPEHEVEETTEQIVRSKRG